MTGQEACIILNLMSGIGPARLNALLAFCGSPEEIFRQSERDLASVQGISPTMAARIVHWEQCVDLKREMDLVRRGGVTILTKYDEEFKELELVASSGVLGVRESRRIIGEYRMSTEDILSGAKFPDAVAKVTFGADLHTKSNKGQHCFKVLPYEIPFRALVPKGYEGIIVAGRCISGSREAMASYRVTGNCCQMGERAALIIADRLKNE